MITSSYYFDSDEWSKNYSEKHDYEFHWNFPVMEIAVTIVVVVGIAIILALCFKCCCGSKKGRVLAPPPVEVVPPQPPGPHYPQQQYNTVTVPAGVTLNTSYPGAAPYPATGAPYPTTGAPYPTTGAPYPNAGAPYPNAGVPYPTPGVGFPATGAPYPAVAPYPPSGPYHSGPSAPDAQAFVGIARPGWQPQALPPSYDQVMTAETTKQAPYNPNYLQ